MKLPIAGSLLVVLFLSGLMAACSRPEAPVFQSVDNLRVKNPGWDSTVVSADVRYYNPNDYSLKLKKAELSVFVNQRFVGRSVLDTVIPIPARDSFSIPVSMKLNMREVFSNALELLMTHEVTIKLDGFARLGRSGIYINTPIQYEGKQKIDLSVH